jgi:hypothetical protein
VVYHRNPQYKKLPRSAASKAAILSLAKREEEGFANKSNEG